MCKHYVMEIILKHNYVDNIWPPTKLLYCLLIINSEFGVGIPNCIYTILTVWDYQLYYKKIMHKMQKIIHNMITYLNTIKPITYYITKYIQHYIQTYLLYIHMHKYIYKIKYYEYNNNNEINHNITFILIK